MSAKRFLYTFVLIAVVTSISYGQVPVDNRDRELDVMTYNMYLGTDFTEIFSVTSFPELIEEVAEAYGDVQAGDPAGKVDVIADQIQARKPSLVGLQEVALWRTGPHDPNAPATTIAYDFLQLLLNELAGRGLHYEAAVVQTSFDAELPGAGAAIVGDVRYTDRDVILVRTDLSTSQLKIEGTQARTFNTLLTLPLFIGNVTVQRGWASVDVKMRGKTYRFINAHTEAFHPGIQYVQTGELLSGPASTSLPVIMVGDFNSDAETGGASYQRMIGAGFADTWDLANPNDPGYTWPLFLTVPSQHTPPSERLDLVLTRGAITTLRAEVVGEDPIADVMPSGFRPSDHAGVAATLVLNP